MKGWGDRLRQWVSALAGVIQVDPTVPALAAPPADWLPLPILPLPDLPVPAAYRTAIDSALTTAVSAWAAADGQTPPRNRLVILADPTEQLDLTLRSAVSDALAPHWLYSWSQRPDWQSAKENLTAAIAALTQTNPQREPPELVVIPDLSQCFLRHADGLAIVEQLGELLLDPSRFWLMGCNHTAWLYLDRACQLGAYFSDTERLTLPPLDGAALQDWLGELTRETLGVVFDSELDAQAYFEKLAAVSGGSAAIAAEVWLRSRRYQLADPARSTGGEQASPLGRDRLGAVTLPQMPSLSAGDRYLLYLLLLHGALSLSDLALGLTLTAGQVQAQLQPLLAVGLVRQQPLIGLHPAYFPGVYADLSRNNFFVDAPA